MIVHHHLVLVGLMGSGKSTVGRLLAAGLRRPLVDTDAVIEAATGRTVREIWLADGEPAFRALEANVLAEALDAPRSNVVAAAGGVVLCAPSRRLLVAPDVTVVWLNAAVDVLVERVTSGAHRPLLDGDPQQAMRQMAADRAELYRSVADFTIDVAACLPGEVADHVMELVDGR